MEPVNVFAVDPGVTTGWALIRGADLSELPNGDGDLNIVASQIMGDENQQAHDLWKIARTFQPCAIVIEDFVPRKLDQSRHFLSPVRLSAKFELYLWLNEKRWWKQMPALAMSTINDNYLRDIGLYITGQPHANDAQRHAITYLRMLLKHPERHGDLLQPRTLDSGLVK